jgi:hypothetical protein
MRMQIRVFVGPAVCIVLVLLVAVACRPMPGKPSLPITPGQVHSTAAATPRPPLARHPTTPGATPAPASPTPAPMVIVQPVPGAGYPTLADFWDGRARFVVDVPDTGLPMGESDTIVMSNGELWSYVHASARSAGTVDHCGDPVEFPGCTVIYRSYDGGASFLHGQPPICQFPCQTCPCTNDVDHVAQQQYPRVFFDGTQLSLVYEWQARVMLRRSLDGLHWSPPDQIDETLIWHLWHRDCPAAERIGRHPFAPFDYECLAGGPPGLYVEDGVLYVFLAQGQNPGAMGCYFAPIGAAGAEYQPCRNNPLFVGAPSYGLLDQRGASANTFFDFRTISAADVQKIGAGAEARYYVLYEGIRGPGPGDPGDTQFGLGLARSLTNAIDGPWEKYAGNPLLVDLPGNIGIGHADIVVNQGRTYLYTSLDGLSRSRLVLAWE